MRTVKHFCLALCVFFISGCGFLKDYHIYDEFKDNHKYTLNYSLSLKEWLSTIGSADVHFVRDINKSGETTTAYFVITKQPQSYSIEKKGYIKIDSYKSEFEINDLRTNGYFVTKSDSTKNKGIQAIPSINDTRLTDQFSVAINPEMIKAIKECKEITFRFYFGPSIATYKIHSSRLNRLKKMLSETPENI